MSDWRKGKFAPKGSAFGKKVTVTTKAMLRLAKWHDVAKDNTPFADAKRAQRQGALCRWRTNDKACATRPVPAPWPEHDDCGQGDGMRADLQAVEEDSLGNNPRSAPIFMGWQHCLAVVAPLPKYLLAFWRQSDRPAKPQPRPDTMTFQGS